MDRRALKALNWVEWANGPRQWGKGPESGASIVPVRVTVSLKFICLWALLGEVAQSGIKQKVIPHRVSRAGSVFNK